MAKFNPHKYKTKAEGVLAMLNEGMTNKEIISRMAVSPSYIWTIKKKMGQQSEAPKPGEYIVVEGAKSAQEIDAILNERGNRYGPFMGHAEVTRGLKCVIEHELVMRRKVLAADQMEALDMICHKIGRIINGDADYDDSWVDIAGYAQLVADRLQGKVR